MPGKPKRPCPLTPDELRASYVAGSVNALARTYQTGNGVVMRWLEEAGIETLSASRGNAQPRPASLQVCPCGRCIYRGKETGAKLCFKCGRNERDRARRARKKIGDTVE